MFEFQKALGRGCDNSDYYQDVMAPTSMASKTSKGARPQPRSQYRFGGRVCVCLCVCV